MRWLPQSSYGSPPVCVRGIDFVDVDFPPSVRQVAVADTNRPAANTNDNPRVHIDFDGLSMGSTSCQLDPSSVGELAQNNAHTTLHHSGASEVTFVPGSEELQYTVSARLRTLRRFFVMLIRRKNWPAFLVIAIFGPVLGAFLAVEFLPFSLCPKDRENDHERVQKQQTDRPESDSEDVAADESLQLPDGDSIALDEIAPERPVAIVVMKGSWCPVCQRQLKRLSKQLRDVQSANAAVVGLTTAVPEQNRRLRQKLGLQFPILSDTSKDFHRRLDMWRDGACHAIPGVVFLDESGDIVKVHRGRYPGKPQDEFVLDTLRKLSR